jgi:hypothetical protein
MVSSPFVPWYNRPAREYPIKRWLRERYGFTVPTWAIARYRQPDPAAWERREFPVKRWMALRQAASKVTWSGLMPRPLASD